MKQDHYMRVLVVEDHKELAATIAVGLRREGMAVDIVFDGHDVTLDQSHSLTDMS